MSRSVLEGLRRSHVTTALYYASTEDMMERLLERDSAIGGILERLRSDSQAAVGLGRDVEELLKTTSSGYFRHPDEMLIVSALFILSLVAPGVADRVAAIVLGRSREEFGWAWRFADRKQRDRLVLFAGGAGAASARPGSGGVSFSGLVH